jgi:hypothetical protein
LTRFVITLKEEPARQEVATVYLMRSYDHDRRTTPNPSRRTTRTSTRRPTRSNTERSSDRIRSTADGDSVTWRRMVNYGNAQAFQIWEVARAATAAPFYFEPLKIETPGSSAHSVFTDAGINFTINPTEEGAHEIEDLYGANSIGVVVSVGTARRTEPWGGGIRQKLTGIANRAANPEVVHEKMREKSSKDRFQYYRLNDHDALSIELDEWKPKHTFLKERPGSKTIQTIRDAFAHWAARKDIQKELGKCAMELVRRRQARTKDPAKWERYAVGAQFRCRFKECEREDFDNRHEFEDHLINGHGMPRTGVNEESDQCRNHWRYRKAASPAIAKYKRK